MKSLFSHHRLTAQWLYILCGVAWIHILYAFKTPETPECLSPKGSVPSGGSWLQKYRERYYYLPPFMACFLLTLSAVLCRAVLISPFANVDRS